MIWVLKGEREKTKNVRRNILKITKYIRKKSLTSQKLWGMIFLNFAKNTKILFLKFHEKNIKVNDFLLNFTKKDHAD